MTSDEPTRRILPHSITSDITNCARCSNDHKSLIFTRLSHSDCGNYSHFALCPITHHPILLEITDDNKPVEHKTSFDDKLKERIINMIVDKLGVVREDINLDSSFVKDLGADSIDVVELVMAFEDEFDIEIPDEDFQADNSCKISTVQQAIDYIKHAI